jgi:hypothetical protein
MSLRVVCDEFEGIRWNHEGGVRTSGLVITHAHESC